ncbi:MAG: type I methionyl aminopeptidase [bacterium]|nr:type I methionyl aminopeptidase [bacterium]
MVTLKSKEEVAIMAVGGKMLAEVIRNVAAEAREGVSLKTLDALAEKLIRRAGALPAFLGYRPHGAGKPYPATICASVNDIIVHGIPTQYKLRSGDVLKLDFGLRHEGFCLDAAVTVAIGTITTEASRLIEATKKALLLGIKAAQPGKHLGDIGAAIATYVHGKKFGIAEGLTGHGIGHELHEDPSVYNFGKSGTGLELVPGLVIAIEPMTTAGSGKLVQLPDDSYATADSSISAHFEHTIAITEKGPIILT